MALFIHWMEQKYLVCLSVSVTAKFKLAACTLNYPNKEKTLSDVPLPSILINLYITLHHIDRKSILPLVQVNVLSWGISLTNQL